MEIILEKSVYDEIQEHIALYPAERGGILGIRNGCISKFYYDSSAICSFNEYIPDTVNLDLVIDAWSKIDIDFIGFVHSHTPNRKTLSPSDIEYAVKVLEVFDELPYLIIGVIGENKSFPLRLFSIFRDGKCEKIKFNIL